MSLVAALRCWAAEAVAVGKTTCDSLAEAYPFALPWLKLGLRATVLAVFWPLTWTWLAQFAVSYVLTSLGWTPHIPASHPKAVQLQDALARAAALAQERDAAKAAERNQSCQLRLLQDECNEKTLQLAKLRQALAAKEVEVRAYRQALGRDGTEPAQGMSPKREGITMEPNTPEERVQRLAWPNGSPQPNAGSASPASASGKAPAPATTKLEHNWDWHDLLGDMGAAITPEMADTKRMTPGFQPPALETEESYSEAAPKEYLDPISLTLITDPVVTPAGVTYDRASITAYIAANHSDPASGAPLLSTMLYPNLALRDLIQKFLVDAPSLSTATSLSAF